VFLSYLSASFLDDAGRAAYAFGDNEGDTHGAFCEVDLGGISLGRFGVCRDGRRRSGADV
jgi:hypothetical protein